VTVTDPRVWRMFDHLKSIDDPIVSEEQLWGHSIYLIHGGSAQFAFASPHTRSTTEEAAREELATLVKLADKLVLHMKTMHQTSLDAVRAAGRKLDLKARIPMHDPLVTLDDICILAIAAHNANIADLPTPAAEKKPAKQLKKTAHDVADMAAGVFHKITGRTPAITTDPVTSKPGGDFYRLLRETFEILRIDANPEGMGNAACARFKAKEETRKK
jgi:hypothetical protein